MTQQEQEAGDGKVEPMTYGFAVGKKQIAYKTSPLHIFNMKFDHYSPVCNLTDPIAVSKWTGTSCRCGTYNTAAEMAADVSAWDAQSVVSAGADYDYRETALMSAFCRPPKANIVHPQGQFFADKLHRYNTAEYNMYLMSGCQKAETTWNGVHNPTMKSGIDLMADWAAANCIPRHN